MNGNANSLLNGICPYFTMFPLDFPYSILKRYSSKGEWVMDPFCGRGTTNYASRMLGLPNVGIDSNPVAVAITQAKLANTTPGAIIHTAKRILDEVQEPLNIPDGEFWELAYHKDVLHTLCRLREGLIKNCFSDSRKALRAIIMGALHGPRNKTKQSYFSNQCTRTYAPKTRYAVSFWKAKGLVPEPVDVLNIITDRALRYYSQETTVANGRALRCDSRTNIHQRLVGGDKIDWVITSPPYYGMHTYIPDQWLRLWFLGGNPSVNYTTKGQLGRSSSETFAQNLRQVWVNVRRACSPRARLVIRFGGINSRSINPKLIIKESLRDSGWVISTIKSAGSASKGKRQALQISSTNKTALEEYDVWATCVA